MIHVVERLIMIYMLILGVVAVLKVAGLLIVTWYGTMIVAFCMEAGMFIAMAVLAYLLEVFDE